MPCSPLQHRDSKGHYQRKNNNDLRVNNLQPQGRYVEHPTNPVIIRDFATTVTRAMNVPQEMNESCRKSIPPSNKAAMAIRLMLLLGHVGPLVGEGQAETDFSGINNNLPLTEPTDTSKIFCYSYPQPTSLLAGVSAAVIPYN